MTGNENGMQGISVVVPALNEAESLPGLIDEIKAAIGDRAEWEIVVVDDGSTDGTFGMLAELNREDPRVRAVRLRTNFGKSQALAVGFIEARGEVIVTMDGDGQDDPAEIPLLLDKLDEGFDLVTGWKRDRRDPWSRRAASKAFNGIAARSAGLKLNDMNSGFKAYRGECARSIEVYGDFHRYIPVLAAQNGWRVTEVPVNHRERRHGASRFGAERYLRGGLDLLSVTFLGRYQNRPLHFFGGIGGALSLIGILICVYLTIVKLGGEAIGHRPLLFLGVLMTVVGVQLLTLGLLGQMLVVLRREETGSATDRARIAERTALSPWGDSGRSTRASTS